MPIKKQKLGPGKLVVGETGSGMEMAKQCTTVAIEPSYGDGERQIVLSGDTDQEAGEWEGNLTATFFQDYAADGLLAWTWDNDGKTLPFTFTPSTSAGFEVAGEVVVRPANIGGDVDAENTSEVEWALPKKPAIAAPGTARQAYSSQTSTQPVTQSASAPSTTDEELVDETV